MASGFVIRKNQYYDSVFLMSVNARMLKVKGVQQTAVLMGSQANKQLLREIGIHGNEIDAAQPNDLIVAAIADSMEIVDQVLGNLDGWLNAIQEDVPVSELHTLEDGLAIKKTANLAVISIPGEYAAREARKAIEAGLNVFIFSGNVSTEEELELKLLAKQKGLLMMGPDCGTSLINGIGIGFANVVRKGSIGAIGAAGTGLQEFTSQVHNLGYGISHAIGTGSHDLSDEIEGLTAFTALDALEKDHKTEVVTFISKPPGPKTLGNLLERIGSCNKPVIGCFLGVDPEDISGKKNLIPANTIDEAVQLAINTTGNSINLQVDLSKDDVKILMDEKAAWSSEQKYLRGILAGGTFCYQSQQILKETGISVYSNSPLDKKYKLHNSHNSFQHSLVDMGDEYFMVGKPHPMIDGTMRRQRIITESHDPEVAILYLDFILGYNASMDPVGELIEAIDGAKQVYKQRGGSLTVIASICGTESDPQDLALQAKLLREAGVLVYGSNAKAMSACRWLLEKGKDRYGNGH
jgi:FdrA protein